MNYIKKLLALLLSFIMLVSFIGCDFDKAGVTSSKTTAQQVSLDVSEETIAETVWIPRTGSKFHKKANCGNMKYRAQITKQEAERRGYEPCKNCYYNE